MPEPLDYCGFIPSAEIQVAGDLFGRNKPGRELHALVSSIVNSHCNSQIIAERRSGKSSLLNCALQSLQSDLCGGNLIGALANFKRCPIVGDVNGGYAFLCSTVLMQSTTAPIWTNDASFEFTATKKLPRCESIADFYEAIISSEIRAEKLFEALIVRLAKQGFSSILLIDEYETMFFRVFGAKVGSAHTIRDLVMTGLDNRQRFQCGIAGARSWDFFSQDIGSDDFNFIDDNIFLRPLNEDECREIMVLGYEQSRGKPKTNIEDWIPKSADLRRYAGGWPYVLKMIANEIAKTGNLDEDLARLRLSSHFSNIWDRLPDEYKLVMKGYETSRRIHRDLVNWGLAEQRTPDTIVPLGDLWREFVDELDLGSEKSRTNVHDQKRIEVHQLGSETTDLISQINETLNGKNLPVVFDTTISSAYPKQFKNITVLVLNEDGFKVFISSIYVILFESTQEKGKGKKKGKTINLGKIPDPFSRKRGNEPDIFHRIDMLRHKFTGAHDTLSKNFSIRRFTPEQCQEHYLGHRNRPSDGDFYKIQVGVLKEFNSFLVDLLKWAEAQVSRP